MIYYGIGSLKLSKDFGFATDGTNIFKVWSPALKLKIWLSKKRNLGILGKWLAIGDKIVWCSKI